MKVDAINFGSIPNQTTIPVQNNNIVEETNSTGDEFDDTRVANKKVTPDQRVSEPIEKKSNGTIEDLMSMQASTQKLAKTYGFSNVEQATTATTGDGQSVSASSSMSFNA